MINEENFNESQRAQCRFVANCVGNSRVSWQTRQRSRFRMTFAVVIFYILDILDAICIHGPGNQTSCGLCKCHTLKCLTVNCFYFLLINKKKKQKKAQCSEIIWSLTESMQNFVIRYLGPRDLGCKLSSISARGKRGSEISHVTRFLRVSLEIRDYSQCTVNRLTRLRFIKRYFTIRFRVSRPKMLSEAPTWQLENGLACRGKNDPQSL